MDEARFTALFHGDSGVGKSWLGDTTPAPRLILDAEGRAGYTPSRPKRYWNPRLEAPPVYDGSWQTCIVKAHDFETLDVTWQWLRSGQHPFVSCTMDSVMEAQKRCIDKRVPGVTALDRDDYSVLLREMEKKVRDYRDLTQVPGNSLRVMVFLCGTSYNEGTKKMEPLLSGALRKLFAYYIDVVGYMFKAPQADGSLVRSLLVDEDPSFTAKDGTNVLKTQYGRIVSLPDTNPPTAYLWQFYELMKQANLAAQAALPEGAA